MINNYIIHLPTHTPKRRPYAHISLDQIQSSHDLPPYLFMGSLDESSFTHGSHGWSAMWKRDDDTWFCIEYDAADKCVHARDAWLGRDGFYTCAHQPDLSALSQMRFMTPVQAWEDQAEEMLQAQWNLKYMKAEDGDWIMAGLPDGLMKTLILPVTVDALPRLIETFIAFREDPEMDFPISGYVVPIMSSVNYIEGHNPVWAENPGDLYMRTFKQTGFPPVDMPVREQGRDGSAAWTIRRIVAVAVIGMPFVGLIPCLERLERTGLIAAGPMCSSDTDPGPDSVEFSACVVPMGKEISSASMAWAARDRHRRVFWKMPDEHMTIIEAHASHRDDDPELSRMAAQHVVSSAQEWKREVCDAIEQASRADR